MRLFCIHGAGCTNDVFAAQLAAFPGAHALTLPGHRSDGTDGPTTIADFADAVERDLTARGWDDAVLCGHSMGGAIALELGLRKVPGVRGVVVIGSGARLRVAPALFESLARDFPAGARALAAMFFADPTRERVDRAVAGMLAVGQAQTIRDFRACDGFDASERLAELHVPLLAVTGERDVLMPPKFAQSLASRVPEGAARILEEAGHFAMLERPDQTNEALRAFVDRMETR
jgi:pimeloyl-ACP methyl ester carboxylesterase